MTQEDRDYGIRTIDPDMIEYVGPADRLGEVLRRHFATSIFKSREAYINGSVILYMTDEGPIKCTNKDLEMFDDAQAEADRNRP